jgi:hypothetical protein
MWPDLPYFFFQRSLGNRPRFKRIVDTRIRKCQTISWYFMIIHDLSQKSGYFQHWLDTLCEHQTRGHKKHSRLGALRLRPSRRLQQRVGQQSLSGLDMGWHITINGAGTMQHILHMFAVILGVTAGKYTVHGLSGTASLSFLWRGRRLSCIHWLGLSQKWGDPM